LNVSDNVLGLVLLDEEKKLAHCPRPLQLKGSDEGRVGMAIVFLVLLVIIIPILVDGCVGEMLLFRTVTLVDYMSISSAL
jgi:hypothetical protein